jgi:hypothetical protein
MTSMSTSNKRAHAMKSVSTKADVLIDELSNVVPMMP